MDHLFRALDSLSKTLEQPPYEERVVARYDTDTLLVDTAAVGDANRPFETAIKSPEYNDDKWIVVEAYDTRHDAVAGHDRWVATMKTEPLPPSLTDCANSPWAESIREFGGTLTFERRVKGAPSDV